MMQLVAGYLISLPGSFLPYLATPTPDRKRKTKKNLQVQIERYLGRYHSRVFFFFLPPTNLA